MGLACQIDETFVTNPPATHSALSRHMLVDTKFFGARVVSIPVPTGIEEAPTVNLNTSSPPPQKLLNDLSQALGRFRTLKALPPGWDSYGGLPVNSGAVVPALQLVLEALQQCKYPRINANGQGGIDLVWETAQAELSITVDSSGLFDVMFEQNDEEVEELPAPVGLQAAKAFLARIGATA